MVKRGRDSSTDCDFIESASNNNEDPSVNKTFVVKDPFKMDFYLLSKTFPILKKHMTLNLKWRPNVKKSLKYHYDFTHPDSVYHLSKSILKNNFNIVLFLPCECNSTESCNMNEDLDIYNREYRESKLNSTFVRFLSPCIPNRLSYIRAISGLLTVENNLGSIESISMGLSSDNFIKGRHVMVLDIGTGASCIYPLLGVSVNSWSFIGTDIDSSALEVAGKNIELNGLDDKIELRHQALSVYMFDGILYSHDFVSLTMCNPPFHASLDKINLNPRTKQTGTKSELVFSFMDNRPWTFRQTYLDSSTLTEGPSIEGHLTYTISLSNQGDLAFIEIMLMESKFYCHNVLWFTSLVAKLYTLKKIKAMIQEEMRQYIMEHTKQEQFLNEMADKLYYENNKMKLTPITTERIQVTQIHTCEFRTFALKIGRQTRWIIAWTYYNSSQRMEIINKLKNVPTKH